MNRLTLSLSTLLALLLSLTYTDARAADTPANEHYDADLALELGADEYGMRSYVFVTLLTGDVAIEDADRRREVFAGHFANMSRLAEEGVLVLAGPMMDAEPKRGIFVFNVAGIEEAEALVKTDPAVQAGVLDYELDRFYSSAALMKINEIHQSIQKTGIE